MKSMIRDLRLKIQNSKLGLLGLQFSTDSGGSTPTPKSLVWGFTLMELLIVIAIIGMLAAILLPTLSNARERANRAVCVGNLKVIGEAFNMYNIDRGEMPPTNATNDATHQIRTAAGRIGMGYFYNDPNLTITTDDYIEDLEVFTCPSSDYVLSSKSIKSDWDAGSATPTTYIYRAESGYADDTTKATLMLSDARPAIVMDYNYTGATSGYNHRGEYVNILFKNGNVKGVENEISPGNPDPDGQLTLGGIGPGGVVDRDDLFHHVDGFGNLDGGADYYQ